MSKAKLLHAFYMLLIGMYLIASPTPMGICQDCFIGFLIKVASILLMALFFITPNILTEQEEDFLKKHEKIVDLITVPYMLLTMWAIWGIRTKLIGFTANGAFYNAY